MRQRYIVIDENVRRRAEIVSTLSELDTFAMPFEGAEELGQFWPRAGYPLVHDSDDLVAKVFDLMDEKVDFRPLVAYSEAPTVDRIVSALQKGAQDYIEFPFQSKDLAARLEHATAGGIKKMETVQRRAEARGLVDQLSPREQDVLSGLTDGNSNKEMARTLGISPRTVEIHRANMMGKLSASHPADAVRIAIEAKITD